MLYIIGSTTLALSQRLAQHVSDYKRWLNSKYHYVTSFKIIENGDYDIVLIENFPCNSKEELHARESHFSRTVPCVNKNKNQGLIYAIGGKIKYGDKYYNEHKEQNQARGKQYRAQNKEQLKVLRKQYRQQHIEQLNLGNKQYRIDHKEEIKKYQNIVINCPCGCSFQKVKKSRHERSKKHQHYEQNKLYYNIKSGLDLIKLLDAQFKINKNIL